MHPVSIYPWKCVCSKCFSFYFTVHTLVCRYSGPKMAVYWANEAKNSCGFPLDMLTGEAEGLARADACMKSNRGKEPNIFWADFGEFSLVTTGSSIWGRGSRGGATAAWSSVGGGLLWILGDLIWAKTKNVVDKCHGIDNNLEQIKSKRKSMAPKRAKHQRTLLKILNQEPLNFYGRRC